MCFSQTQGGTFHLEWFAFDELGTSAFHLDSNMLLWKSEKTALHPEIPH